MERLLSPQSLIGGDLGHSFLTRSHTGGGGRYRSFTRKEWCFWGATVGSGLQGGWSCIDATAVVNLDSSIVKSQAAPQAPESLNPRHSFLGCRCIYVADCWIRRSYLLSKQPVFSAIVLATPHLPGPRRWTGVGMEDGQKNQPYMGTVQVGRLCSGRMLLSTTRLRGGGGWTSIFHSSG